MFGIRQATSIFRGLRRQKGYIIINIAGLAVGLASAMLIALWIGDELGFDRFHRDSDRIYRIMSEGGKYQWKNMRGTPAPLAEAISREIPEVERAARFATTPRVVFQSGTKAMYEERGLIADPSLFEIFSFPFVQGDSRTALAGPNRIVLTRSLGLKYFGDADPLGQTVRIDGRPFLVAGVLRDIPADSHIRFDYLASFEFIGEYARFATHWGAFNFVTYVKLHNGADPAAAAAKMTELAKAKKSPQVLDGVEFRLLPLRKAHLDPSGYVQNWEVLGDRRVVLAFALIGGFVLLIASINFITGSTARSADRAREVGIRKVAGASRGRLAARFFGESLVLVFIAGFAAMIAVFLSLPAYNALSGKSIAPDRLFRPDVLGSFLAVTLLAGLLAGVYPALVLSSFRPIAVLRGSASTGSRRGLLRRILVVVQFALFILLVLCTAVLFRQMRFIRDAELGFDKDNVVVVPVKENIGKSYDAFKAALLAEPAVSGVTAQSYMFSDTNWRTTDFDWEGRDPNHIQDLVISPVDADFFETLDMELVQGRGFSGVRESGGTTAFVLNEAAVKAMRLDAPVGKWFSASRRQGVIVGIVRDAHLRSFRERIEPRVFWVIRSPMEMREGVVLFKIRTLSRRDAPRAVHSALTAARRAWESINAVTPFEFRFLDDHYNSLYKTESRISTLLNIFAGMAVLIAGLGLFGLSSFLAERRTKEIGIRKILGASGPSLLRLMSGEFVRLAAVANVLVWPMGYLAMDRILRNFAYRVRISPIEFAVAALVSLSLAVAAVSAPLRRAAGTDPARALRYE
jgi:predicted permease